MSAPIRLLLVDDHPVVRMGLAAMLAEHADMEVVAQAGDGEAAVRLYREHRPDITLMDMRMPGMSGADAIAALRAIDPGARVLVLTTYGADEDVFRALSAGARGYLLKGTFPEAVLEAIRAVHAGQRWVPADIAARLAQRVSQPSLTARELEVLALVGEGLANHDIAGRLHLSEFTVKNHLKKIFEKLGVADRTQAVIEGVRRGIIRL